MGVGAAHAERGHPDARGTVGGRERGGLDGQPDSTGAPIDVGGGGVGVQRARQGAVPQGQHGLDDTRNTGRGLCVADVGLEGAQQERVLAVLSVGGEQRTGLDRVAQCGSGAVCLDRVHVGGTEPGVGQCVTDDLPLRDAVGGGQATAGTVGVDRGPAQHGEHGVPVVHRVGQAFDDQHARTLGPAGPVRAVTEGLAAAVGGQAALPGELDEHARGGHGGGSADQRQPALIPAQRAGGQVQGDQRRRAGGVDGEGGATQAEGVGEAAGGDAECGAGEGVPLDAVAVAQQ